MTWTFLKHVLINPLIKFLFECVPRLKIKHNKSYQSKNRYSSINYYQLTTLLYTDHMSFKFIYFLKLFF